MKILHICNDFAGSKVYVNLVKKMDDIGINQIIYCPVRNKFSVGKNQFIGNNIDFYYSVYKVMV